MSYTNRGQLDQYRKLSTQSEIMSADPHRLIQMLMEGALEKIATAKGHMIRGQIAEKGRHVSWAISIIDGLKMSLDKKVGGPIAENLEALYDYMERRLVLANAENNAGYLDEVTSLLREIKGAWDAIPEAVRKNPAQDTTALADRNIVNVTG